MELWRWRLRNPVTGRLFTSRYAMTEADALDVDPLAVRLPCSKVALTAACGFATGVDIGAGLRPRERRRLPMPLARSS